MADDDSGGLSVPSTTNYDQWTFEQVLKALTNEGADLHTLMKTAWFKWNDKPGGEDEIGYHAYDHYYYGLGIDHDASKAWINAVDLIDEMMPDVARGKRGTMDQQTLMQLAGAIDDLDEWSQAVRDGMHSWSDRLDSDDSSFKGKAAFLIYWRLKVKGDGLDDAHEQLASRHGEKIAYKVQDAANELANFNATMSSSWNYAMSTIQLRDMINNRVISESNNVYNYIVANGLVKGTSNYQLNDRAGPKRRVAHPDEYWGSVDQAKAWIQHVLSSYPKGDLTSASTWDKINQQINTDVSDMVKAVLDLPARLAMGRLAPKYIMATSSMIELTAPPPETAPKPDTDPPDGGGGDNKDLPPPPDGDGGGNNKINLPPDGDGGGNDKINLPPDGGGGSDGLNLPPDGGGGANDLNLPPDGGGGANDLNLPPDGGGGADGLNLPSDGGGGANDLNLPPDGDGGANDLNLPPDGDGGANGLNLPSDGGGGANDLNLPPDGGGGNPANGGADGFLPGLVPPGGVTDGNGGTNGNNGIGPGSDGAFDENGLGNDIVTPPAEDGDGFSQLPDGSSQSNTQLPPSGNAQGGLVDLGTPADGGTGANGLSLGTDGFGSDPGKGFGSGANLLGTNGGGGNLFGTNGGAGNLLGGLGGPGGGPGNSGLTGLPTQLSGGSPGVNGTPGSSGDGSGVPFFPPMMGGGGAGGNGEKPQERERQTWLSEDEEIWGTRVGVRSGAIGRLDDEEDDVEEFPLVGPSRRQQRAETPRRPRPDEKRDAERESTSSEEASGSV